MDLSDDSARRAIPSHCDVPGSVGPYLAGYNACRNIVQITLKDLRDYFEDRINNATAAAEHTEDGGDQVYLVGLANGYKKAQLIMDYLLHGHNPDLMTKDACLQIHHFMRWMKTTDRQQKLPITDA